MSDVTETKSQEKELRYRNMLAINVQLEAVLAQLDRFDTTAEQEQFNQHRFGGLIEQIGWEAMFFVQASIAEESEGAK